MGKKTAVLTLRQAITLHGLVKRHYGIDLLVQFGIPQSGKHYTKLAKMLAKQSEHQFLTSMISIMLDKKAKNPRRSEAWEILGFEGSPPKRSGSSRQPALSVKAMLKRKKAKSKKSGKKQGKATKSKPKKAMKGKVEKPKKGSKKAVKGTDSKKAKKRNTAKKGNDKKAKKVVESATPASHPFNPDFMGRVQKLMQSTGKTFSDAVLDVLGEMPDDDSDLPPQGPEESTEASEESTEESTEVPEDTEGSDESTEASESMPDPGENDDTLLMEASA